MIDDIVECAICDDKLDVEDGASYYLVTDQEGRPYDLLCRKHDLGDVFDRITMVDGRLVDPDDIMLGEWLDARKG